MSYTQQDYERDLKILEDAPEGATHISDDYSYWILSENQNIKDQSFIEGKGFRSLSTWGFSFRSLYDIRSLVSMYEQLQGDTNE